MLQKRRNRIFFDPRGETSIRFRSINELADGSIRTDGVANGSETYRLEFTIPPIPI